MAPVTTRTVKRHTANSPATELPATKPPTRPGSPSIDDLLQELEAVASAPFIYESYLPTHPPQKLSSATAPIVSVADEAISIIPSLRNNSVESFYPSMLPTTTELSLCPESSYVADKTPLFEGITSESQRRPVIRYQTLTAGIYPPAISKASPSASELSALIQWDLIKDREPRRQPCESPKLQEKAIVIPVISSGTAHGVPGYKALTLKRKAYEPFGRDMFGAEAENFW